MAEMLDEEHLAVKCIVLINSCMGRNYSCRAFCGVMAGAE